MTKKSWLMVGLIALALIVLTGVLIYLIQKGYLFGSASTNQPQSSTTAYGYIVGNVYKPNGAPLEGATVTASTKDYNGSNEEGIQSASRRTTTDSTGYFKLKVSSPSEAGNSAEYKVYAYKDMNPVTSLMSQEETVYISKGATVSIRLYTEYYGQKNQYPLPP